MRIEHSRAEANQNARTSLNYIEEAARHITCSAMRTGAFVRVLLTGNFEVDRDLRLNLDRLAIQQVRPVFPLPYGICCGSCQHGVATDHLHVGNNTLFADGGQQLDRPFLAQL